MTTVILQINTRVINGQKQNMTYIDFIKEGYEERFTDFRHYVSRKAIALGEDVMPNDVSDLMNKADNSGRFKHILFNGFVNCYGKMLLMIDIYEGLGGGDIPLEHKELTIENLQNYF